MSWVAAAVGGASALLGSMSADRASDAQTGASDAAIAEQRRQFNLIRQDNAPYRNIGTQALNALGGIYGYGQPAPNPATDSFGGTPLNQQDWQAVNSVWGNIRRAGNYGDISQQDLPQGLSPEAAQFLQNNWGNIRNAANFGDINWEAGIVGAPGYQRPQQQAPQNAMAGPDYSAFYRSPDYQFRRNEGTRDIQNSFAARGGAASGNALRALTEFNSNLAAGEFGNYFNRQSNLAGIGQTANAANANAGMNTAANVGNALMERGDARASGILGQGAAWNNALLGGYNNWAYGRPGAKTPDKVRRY